MIKLHNLCKVYRSEEVETAALSNIDLNISTGEFVAIMGPSGCGKSTLLNILGMLDQPTSGQYTFQSEEIGDWGEGRLSKLRKNNIGFIFQSFNLLDELTVSENISLALLYNDISGSERKERVAEVMDKVGIAHRAKHMPRQLSGGQQQRVAIARAIVGNKNLLLADEPTGNLDTTHGDEVMNILRGLNEEGATIIMVTHNPAHSDYASRLIHLLDGRIVTENLRAAVA